MKQKFEKGSYTIEASLLMGILIPLLISIIYLGFFLHNKAFLQAAAHETAALYSLHAEDDKDVSGVVTDLVSGRMLGNSSVSGQASASKRQVSVSYDGSFSLPGMLYRFFLQSELNLKTRVQMSTERPSHRISKLRSMIRVVDRVRNRRRSTASIKPKNRQEAGECR
ncbi:MAG: TadE/TadG family type IV pilus assembly protein [Eubacteriales bacterium]|nr:TadE/TadG family type IV pilus assembly protein [Eubacteriales bacterium]